MVANMSDAPPAGWFPDPEAPTQLRYWNGSAWTDERHAYPAEAPPVYGEVAAGPINVPALLAAGGLLILAGLSRAVSYLLPYEAFGAAILFSAVEVLSWVGVFLCFLAAGYPSLRRGVRVLTLVLVGLYLFGGIFNVGMALSPYGSAGVFALSGLFGLATFGVGFAFAAAALRTPALARRLAILPLALYLGLVLFGIIAGVVNAAAASVGGIAMTAGLGVAAASGLVAVVIGALFVAFGRDPNGSNG